MLYLNLILTDILSKIHVHPSYIFLSDPKNNLQYTERLDFDPLDICWFFNGVPHENLNRS
jgi:hypothetical protein